MLRIRTPATPQTSTSASGIAIQSTVLRLNRNRLRDVAIVAMFYAPYPVAGCRLCVLYCDCRGFDAGAHRTVARPEAYLSVMFRTLKARDDLRLKADSRLQVAGSRLQVTAYRAGKA